MTYYEKLLDAMKYISNRHSSRGVNIEFIKYQTKDRENDYSWVVFKADNCNIEVRLDLKSLMYDLHLYEPDFITAFPSIGLNEPGFMIRLPENWEKDYKDKEYVEEDYKFPIPFWRCSDEFFEERYRHFDETIVRIKSMQNESED